MNFAVENEGNSYTLTAAMLIYTGGSPGGHPNCPTYGHPNCSTWAGVN